MGLWPRSVLLGPNWTRLPEAAATRDAVAITIDDGPHPDITPRVLELLDEHGAKATFFCVGEKVRRYPEIAREILHGGTRSRITASGMCITSHSWVHGALMKEIGRAQESITAVTGSRPGSSVRPPACAIHFSIRC